MQIYISYFYQIRNFPDTLIPLSTAMYDPKWYNNNNVPYLDKRGILNGLRLPDLSPYKLDESVLCDPSDDSFCDKNPSQCKFLSEYSKYLDTLNFDTIYNILIEIADGCSKARSDGKTMDICLMVYETPNNPCSERIPLIEYFKKHGIEVKEFNMDH